MNTIPEVDSYILSLPDWQQVICQKVRRLIHKANADIIEIIKFTNRPYFVLNGNVCALLATKDHINVFIYDPIAPDPAGLINQGAGNVTARSIQIYQHDTLDEKSFIDLIKRVVENNQQGGWRKLKNT